MIEDVVCKQVVDLSLGSFESDLHGVLTMKCNASTTAISAAASAAFEASEAAFDAPALVTTVLLRVWLFRTFCLVFCLVARHSLIHLDRRRWTRLVAQKETIRQLEVNAFETFLVCILDQEGAPIPTRAGTCSLSSWLENLHCRALPWLGGGPVPSTMTAH
jgi:hypothetical protein